jgi:hypothetical protein
MGYRYVRAPYPGFRGFRGFPGYPRGFGGFRAVAAVALVSLAGLAVAGCARSASGSSAAPTTVAESASSDTVATEDTGTTAGTEPSTSGAVLLADGRYPAYVKKVDTVSRTVTIDVIQFFTGAAAAKAASEDKQESPPPNDYYIRNTNKRLRTLPVAETARITVNVLGSQETGDATKDLPVDLPKLASYFPTPTSPLFWVTVQHDEIENLQEQFLP